MPRKLIDAASLPVRDLWLHDDTCAGRPVRAVLVEDIEKAEAVVVPDRKSKDEYIDYGVVKINSKGKYKLNLAYTEITRLHVMLEENQIPHFFHRFYDGWQVIYPNAENRRISAVQHYFSYGARENRLEIMGGITPQDETGDSVLGHLTAENVFERIVTMHKASFQDNAEHCVCCGEVIPEGRQVCPYCEREDKYV